MLCYFVEFPLPSFKQKASSRHLIEARSLLRQDADVEQANRRRVLPLQEALLTMGLPEVKVEATPTSPHGIGALRFEVSELGVFFLVDT